MIPLLFNSIVAPGIIPKLLLEVHLVPLDRPKQDPTQCAPKRPISFSNALPTTLEAAELNILQPKVESTWEGEQYAYRSNTRGGATPGGVARGGPGEIRSKMFRVPLEFGYQRSFGKSAA